MRCSKCQKVLPKCTIPFLIWNGTHTNAKRIYFFFSFSLSCHYFIILILSLSLLIFANSDLCPWPILPSIELHLLLADLAKSPASAFAKLHPSLSAESLSWFGCLCLILGIGFCLISGIIVLQVWCFELVMIGSGFGQWCWVCRLLVGSDLVVGSDFSPLALFI